MVFEQQETDSLLSNYISRSDLANQIGSSVTKRTLRYWESVGLIPKARRIGREAYYPISTVQRVRMLAATRPASIRKFRSMFNIKVEQDGDTLILRFRKRS